MLKGQIVSLGIVTLEDETTTLCQNRSQLLTDVVSYPRKVEA
jgi:hypothetical protein